MLDKSKKKRESKVYNEKYTVDVQKLYLNMLLSDPEAFSIARSILEKEYFDDKLQPAVEYIMEYAEDHKKLPAVEQVKAFTGVTLEKFSEGELHTESLLKEVEGFCQYKAMELAVLDGVDLLQSGRASEIVERTKSAMTISLMSDLGTEYFGDPETRLKRMLDKSAYVSTGWEALDKKLFGGFTRGGLNIFAGGSGSGKSIFLQNLAINWAFLGFTVIYVSLELAEELVAIRLDAMITGRGTGECLRNIDETVMRINGSKMKNKPGAIYIKKLPEGGTTINTVRAYIKEFQIKTGLKPDAIIIDYLDLMYPTNSKIDPSDQFIKDKFVSEEIRGFAHETNTISGTASQLNRCISLDSQVMEKTRGYVRIDSLKIGDQVLGSNGFVVVKAIDKPRKQKAFRIKTKSGKTIICSKNHRFPTDKGLISIETGLSEGCRLNTTATQLKRDNYEEKF